MNIYWQLLVACQLIVDTSLQYFCAICVCVCVCVCVCGVYTLKHRTSAQCRPTHHLAACLHFTVDKLKYGLRYVSFARLESNTWVAFWYFVVSIGGSARGSVVTAHYSSSPHAHALMYTHTPSQLIHMFTTYIHTQYTHTWMCHHTLPAVASLLNRRLPWQLAISGFDSCVVSKIKYVL